MFKPALILGLLLVTAQASAADPITDAMQKAYGPYRAALFKTNSNSQTEALQAVTQAQQGWSQIATQFGAKPAAPYDRDTDFAKSLAEVSKVYAKATEQIGRNELAEAHETLEHARDIMSDMRHRNNVSIYSDHMNAYHAQMEVVLIDGPKTLAGPHGMQELTAQTGALEFLAVRLKTEAPAEYLQNEEFNAMLKMVEKSVAELKAALFTNDASQVKVALGKLKAPYSKLFLKFG
ncbi:MAG: hypothetical protein H6R19_575 [Proteobacteria bacterium]|nr:hypothetical protein [Pseudomonadota bacterium]